MVGNEKAAASCRSLPNRHAMEPARVRDWSMHARVATGSGKAPCVGSGKAPCERTNHGRAQSFTFIGVDPRTFLPPRALQVLPAPLPGDRAPSLPLAIQPNRPA